MLLGAGCAVISVVLASTGTTEEDSIVLDETDIIQSIDSDITEAQKATSSIQLKLPELSNYEATKSGSGHSTYRVIKNTTITDESITNDNAENTENIKTISTTPVAAVTKNNTVTDIDNPEWQSLKVKRGDSLSLLFDRAKIKPAQLLKLMKLGKATSELKRIHPGDTIKVISDNEGKLLSLNYQIDGVRYLQVERENNDLTANILKHHIEVRSAYATVEIESSLFLASAKAGLSQNTTMELANVFGWDIDFALDIRKGDKFTVIYEERFKNGNKIKDGNILAAEFINQGKVFRALRYTDPVTNFTGYYSPNGHSLRKAFLRSPVKFSRISSRFTTKRYHPILHKFRSHKGVDYAAGRGTPIRASGDGKIIYKGKKGGYGRTVIIKHGSRYTTLYAHMNSYNRKIRSGGRVKQGQVIGYVGSSGLASGPHLHYEFRVNGVHRNPLTVKFPSTKPIPKRYRDNFELTTSSYLAQLDVLSRNALALNDK
ncbi:MAG: peptidase M23 [endosymbiont of Galathealinum brachiosum]|uniref:Peptidase M23 n=1 Tax=endosymbiont of Galathealinum brachiosum TaxID=2200906 RepID=A0A370DG44_9GAMM|nr:MAG: peptidase M23 [endosymbiont of Galathealinum brachiosum]